MTTQHITESSPASAYALQAIEKTPGISTAELSERSGWSVYHLRNVLRYLRKHKYIRSERIMKHCRWWIGEQVQPVKTTIRREVNHPKYRASVFALGAQ